MQCILISKKSVVKFVFMVFIINIKFSIGNILLYIINIINWQKFWFNLLFLLFILYFVIYKSAFVIFGIISICMDFFLNFISLPELIIYIQLFWCSFYNIFLKNLYLKYNYQDLWLTLKA